MTVKTRCPGGWLGRSFGRWVDWLGRLGCEGCVEEGIGRLGGVWFACERGGVLSRGGSRCGAWQMIVSFFRAFMWCWCWALPLRLGWPRNGA